MKKKYCLIICAAVVFTLMVTYCCTIRVHAEETEPIKNGWVKEDGAWYWYQDGVMAAETVLKIDGAYYGFDANGRMYNNKDFFFYNDNEGHYNWYRAKEGGKLYVNEWYKKTENNGTDTPTVTWYYYGAEGKSAEGYVKVGNHYYCFSSSGIMADEGYYIGAGCRCFSIDQNGYATPLEAGWHKIYERDRYCLGDGYLVHNEAKQIDNNWYVFDSNGTLIKGQDFEIYDSETGESVWYRAKADGTLYVNSWYSVYNIDYKRTFWWYYGEEGKAANGLTLVDNVYYFFHPTGQMLIRTLFSESGKWYTVNNSGIVAPLEAGWNKIDDVYYYGKTDGTPAQSEALQIDNV